MEKIVKTILVPATHAGPMWQGVIRSPAKNSRILRIVKSDRADSSSFGPEGDRRSGWYVPDVDLTINEAIEALINAAWDDEVVTVAGAKHWLRSMGYVF
jgi:hypothetical protein